MIYYPARRVPCLFAIPVLLVLLGGSTAAGAAEPVHHALEVVIEPTAGRIQVVDQISLPAPAGGFQFTLNEAFEPESDQPGTIVRNLRATGLPSGLALYRVDLDPPRANLTLTYGGRIAESGRLSAAQIGAEGVYLSARGGWYPHVEDVLHTFSLVVTVPAGWEAISQGAREELENGSIARRIHWSETRPQDDLYLIAGPLHRFHRVGELADAEVYLRSAGEFELANGYLDATERYLALYTRLIGPYPYHKFALVENFWESGYGMPSFTLLGSRVLRFPFIIHTSYPHEILHNWWGNGVYVDVEEGNWAEGLTAYLSDHLLREIRGAAVAYRRDALQKYRNYVARVEDFPLSGFVAKHGDASEAVGYNKTLMLFHMLRRKLGDDIFLQGLRRFYAKYRFAHAGYNDLRRAFEQVSGRSLSAFFAQWIERTGAPSLSLENPGVVEEGGRFRLTGVISQTQLEPPYRLRVPVLVQTRAGMSEFELDMKERTLSLDHLFDSRPLRILVDPYFDLFRRLDPSEIPPSLGELFGSEKVLAILPGSEDARSREAYRLLARRLGANRVVTDVAQNWPPAEQVVWVLGWENRFAARIAATLKNSGGSWTRASIELDGKTWPRDRSCMVIAGRVAALPFAWIGCDLPQAFDGLARKLPHYGKYSYLGFEGAAPDNRLKGKWAVTGSALDVWLAAEKTAVPLTLPVRPPLTDVPPGP